MTTQFLSVPDGRLAYDDTGSGPLIIAVPSMGDLRAEYRFLTPQLVAAGYRVVSLDARGHGETSVQWPDYSVAGVGQDILALARALDAGPVILMGESMAGGAAVWAAAEAPEQVKALVLLDPVVRGEVSPLFRLLLGVLFTRPWGPAAWLMYFKTLFPTRPPADYERYAAALKRNLSAPGRLEALHGMMIASKQASAERVRRVSAPALVIMGAQDPDFKDPAAEARWLAGELNAPYELIAGAGHYTHVEFPELAGARILAFLDTLQTEAKHGSFSDVPSRA